MRPRPDFRPDSNKGPYVYKQAPIYQPLTYDPSLSSQFQASNQVYVDKFNSY
jgi:hypothetical protein